MLKALKELALDFTAFALDFIAFAEFTADDLGFVNTFLVAIVLVALTTLACVY